MNHIEEENQKALFTWAKMMEYKYPELVLMHHIPNGGKRNAREGARLKAEGVKAGIPDIFLPAARGRYHGMYIEMKTERGRLSEAQKKMIDLLRDAGYICQICRGWAEAKGCIENYLNLPGGIKNGLQ